MAATRGNGEIGENVTHNARCIKGLPMKIRETGKVIVRGECILSYNDFEKIMKVKMESTKIQEIWQTQAYVYMTQKKHLLDIYSSRLLL